MEAPARLHVGDVRHLGRDAVEVVEVQFDTGLVGQRQQVEHRIGRSTERRQDGDGVLERLLGHDHPRRDAEAEQVHHCLAGTTRVVFATAVDGRRRCCAGQRHADRLGDRAHRVGREHAAARTLAGASVPLDLGELVFGDGAERAGPDCLEHAGDVEGPTVVLARQRGTVVDEHAGEIEPGRRHQHGRDALVAPRKADEAVESFGMDDGLDGVADDLTADERGAHALVTHADAVADRDGAELHRETACGAHTDLAELGEFAQRHVAGRDLVPCRGDADLRLHPVVVGHADGAEHGAGRRLLDSVGDVAAARLDVDWGVRGSGHDHTLPLYP